MSEFKPGDIVILKSGGPKMTVESTGQDMSGQLKVWCEWIDSNKKYTETFSPASLELKK